MSALTNQQRNPAYKQHGTDLQVVTRCTCGHSIIPVGKTIVVTSDHICKAAQ